MIDKLFMQDLARDIAPPLEPVEQPATLLAAGPATSDVGQVTVQGYNEAKPSGVRVGRAGISPEQSAKAGGLDRPLVALLDTLAGALQGATAQTLGLPGDIRSILDLISKEGATKYLGEPVFPTTEQMQEKLPAVIPQGVANQADREQTAKMFSNVGTFLPAPGIPEAAVQGAKMVGKAIQATKGLPVGMSIQDVSESMKAANAWANPKEFLAQIEDAGQKENMAKIDKNMRQYAEQGMPLSKIKKELERDIGLKLSTDQTDYVSGFVKSIGKAELPLTIKPILFTGLSSQSLPIAQKIVSEGVASNMSPTKMIQAFEQQTGTKLTGKQQKELKEYVSANVPKGQVYSDQAFKDLIAQPFPFEPSTQRFEKAFNDAINYVKTATPEAIRGLAIQANQRLAPILGVGADGKTKRLLTTNGKLLKTETGIEGGVPIELPDGRNIESAGLAISPAFKANKFSTCPNSASCAQECLGKTSGGYFAYGGGADLDAMKGTRLRSFRMTQAMFREPEAFAIKLNEEIFSLKKAAEKNGNALAIRLNVLSDIDPKVHKSIIEANPDVLFYDYTKMKYRPVAPNHHYTYSSTGLSQKAGQNGLTTDVDNPHANWTQMRQWLDDGQNVAMAFSSKKGLPESVFDEATGKTYQVIDGDAYDFRPMDAQPKGSNGVIVGLKNKAMTRKESLAAQDSKGFFVQYDPKLGTEVIIPRQKKEVIMLKTDGQTTSSPMDTGEQITERTAK